MGADNSRIKRKAHGVNRAQLKLPLKKKRPDLTTCTYCCALVPLSQRVMVGLHPFHKDCPKKIPHRTTGDLQRCYHCCGPIDPGQTYQVITLPGGRREIYHTSKSKVPDCIDFHFKRVARP